MNTLLAFGMPGPTELVIIAIIAMLLIGPTMLPKAARGIGSVFPNLLAGFKEAKDELKNAKQELQETSEELKQVVSGEPKKS